MLKNTIRAAFRAILHALGGILARIRPWYRWPVPIGILCLRYIRDTLRRHNLIDVRLPQDASGHAAPASRARHYRTPDGTSNDLDHPGMGAAKTHFGRNVALGAVRPAHPDPITDGPNPREISRDLLTRSYFKPAKTLNLLAAAWVQFQVHDWFAHSESNTKVWDIPRAPNDEWPDPYMRVRQTEVDGRIPGSKVPAFKNDVTHWWDASQIYGSDRATEQTLRSNVGGKLRVQASGLLELNKDGIDLTGFNKNFWLGLSLLHTLFTWEHNTICDRLHELHSSWNDEHLFRTARLINAALIAKIHTIEWTPALLAHPTTEKAMSINWWGALGEGFRTAVGRISDDEVISGIMGSPVDHHGTPFSMTEEFVTVYRMHPLLPDELELRRSTDGTLFDTVTLENMQGEHTRDVMTGRSLDDLFYSFGTAYPGAITLGNYPEFFQKFTSIPDAKTQKRDFFDLGAVDILRDRERGVPRYNEFRRQMHLKPVGSFRELSPEWAAALKRLYGDVEKIDAMVGMLAETPPPGFAFSETAFRVFAVMASRRLKSDRFYTDDFRPEIYTQLGMDWINTNTMHSVLVRHLPELKSSIHPDNAFKPWTRLA